MRQVLIIIPTYNEAANIDGVVKAVETMASKTPKYAFSILVADDLSPDGTAKAVKKLQRRYGNIRISSGPKEGLGRAYLRGFRYALGNEAFHAVVMMDGDFSHDPEDIPALLSALDEGSDYVIGSRYIAGGSISKDWPVSRMITSRIANFLARKLGGISDEIMDITGGFKAIRLEALRAVNPDSINARGYIFQVSLLHAFLKEGFAVREVPITFANRTSGISKLRLWDVVEFLYRAYKLNDDAPIQRIARFALVGASGTVVNLIVLSILVNLARIDVLISVALAIETSIIFNFFMNHYYTFKGYGTYRVRKRKDPAGLLFLKMAKFNVGMLGGALISFMAFTVLFKALRLHYLLADIIAILIAMSWNYYVSVRFVWKAVD